jgi:hypothetical protein
MSESDLKQSVHRLTNKLQAILGFLELEQYEKALKAAKETIAELHRMVAAIAGMCVMLPKDGSVVVVPHGTRVVSSDDVNVDVDSDEVRVVGASSVRAGQGEHNPRTK